MIFYGWGYIDMVTRNFGSVHTTFLLSDVCETGNAKCSLYNAVFYESILTLLFCLARVKKHCSNLIIGVFLDAVKIAYRCFISEYNPLIAKV